MKTATLLLAGLAVGGLAVVLWIVVPDHRNALERSIDLVERSKTLTTVLHDPKEPTRIASSARVLTPEQRANLLSILKRMPLDTRIAACGFHPDVSVLADGGTLQFCLGCNVWKVTPTRPRHGADGAIRERDAFLQFFAKIYPQEPRFKAAYWIERRRTRQRGRGPSPVTEQRNGSYGLEGYETKGPHLAMRSFPKNIYPGNALISRDPADQVLPPRRSLTAVFGMGTGVASSLWSPE